MRADPSTLEVTGHLGSGGEADVLRVHNTWDGQDYALRKSHDRITSPSSGHGDLALFVRHPRLLQPIGRRVNSEGRLEELVPLIRCVSVHDATEAGGAELVLSLLIQAVSALNSLHSAGLVHRDIKPENLLVEETGGVTPWISHRLVVADLSCVARVSDALAEQGLTGTLGFMSPELLAGSPHSVQSDQFALGCWLHWVLTGDQLLLRGNTEETLRAYAGFEGFRSTSTLRHRSKSALWADLLVKLLAPSPDQRFSSTSELLSLLIEEALRQGGASAQVLSLTWNPGALLPGEVDRLERIELTDPGQTRMKVSVVRMSREVASREALRVIECRRMSWSPASLVVHSEADPLEVMRRISDLDPQTVVLEAAPNEDSLMGRLVHQIVEEVSLRGGHTNQLYVLEHSGLTSRPSELVRGEAEWADTEIIEPEPDDVTSATVWTRLLFSGLEIDPVVLGDLRSSGVSTADEVSMVFENAIKSDDLLLEAGQITWNPSRSASIKESLRVGGTRSLEGLTELASRISDLFETLPEGLNWEQSNLAESAIPGWTQSIRELLARGVLLNDSTQKRLVSSAAPRVLVGRAYESGIEVRDLAARLYAALGQNVSDQGMARCVLHLRAGQGSPSDEVAVVGYARRMLNMGLPGPTLRALQGLTRRGGLSESPRLLACISSTQGVALAQLGELTLAAGAWENARRAYAAIGRPLSAARAALEGAYHQTNIPPGFTTQARLELSGVTDVRADAFRKYLDSEELVHRGFQVGYSAIEGDLLELEDRGSDVPSVHASMLLGLGRVALEAGGAPRARELGLEALNRARASGNRTILTRVLTFLAALEEQLGHATESKVFAVERDRYLGAGRWTQRIAGKALQAAGFYGQGRIRDVLRIELENLSEAVFMKHSRLEVISRKNLVWAYLHANRPAQALTVLGSLANVLAQLPQLSTSALKVGELAVLRAAVLSEIGAAEEAFNCCTEGLKDAGDGEGLQIQFLRRQQAILIGRRGDFGQCQSMWAQVSQAFRSAGAVDEVLETDLYRLQSVPSANVQDEDLEALGQIESRAAELGLGRILQLARLTRLQVDKALGAPERLSSAWAVRESCSLLGLGRIGLDATLEAVRAHLDLGQLSQALHLQQEAMEELRGVSEGLRAFPVYREAYFRDPRRQRFLEVGRRLAGGGG